jgi:CSLREA domain-containing protein
MSSVHISQLMVIRTAIVLVVMAVAVIGAREAQALSLPEAYTVTTTVDDPTLATCDLIGSGQCSLRAAIIAANAHVSDQGPDVIRFGIAPYGIQTITLSATYGELPVLSGPTTVDGTTQLLDANTSGCIDTLGSPCIRIDGVNTTGGGLLPNAPGTTVEGLAIYGFAHAGAIVVLSDGDGTVIVRNFLGTPDGVVPGGDSYDGVFVDSGATGVTIGGSSALERNVISGNNQVGVYLRGDENVVKGNYIGTNKDGSAALANMVGVYAQGNDNSIGEPGVGNLISGNGVNTFMPAVWVQTGMDNKIVGNLIGTNAAGDDSIQNATGVLVDMGAQNTTIGGSTPGARNVISGNTQVGVHTNNDIGTKVQGNDIGTNAAGSAAVPNLYGILVENSSAVQIGGTAAERNVISGNVAQGIFLKGANPDQPTAIQGNYIGLNASGTAAIANAGSGILVGGDTPAVDFEDTEISHNVISGNALDGIRIDPWTDSDVSGTHIGYNIIGLNAAGTDAVPNAGVGVRITTEHGGNASNNDIGDRFQDGVRNVISGNTGDGIQLLGPGTYFNEVLDAYIGTDAAGSSAIGNGGSGVHIYSGAERIDILRSTIAGNAAGIEIANDSTRNDIGGNYIGTNAALKSGLGNASYGIHVVGSDNQIGATAFTGNVIRNNGAAGVHIQGLASLHNKLSENLINNNVSLGIDLVDGANANQATPVLALADASSSTDTHIVGTLTSTASTAFHIEFFASPTCDQPGTGEGRDFLGSDSATTSPGGVATINSSVPRATGGQSITATATDPAGNTSEFSNCVTATGPTPEAGDADCDGDVDIDDVLAALEDAADVEEAPCHGLTDVDCDGDVTGNDALRILLFVGGTKPAPTGCV